MKFIAKTVMINLKIKFMQFLKIYQLIALVQTCLLVMVLC